MQKEPPACLLLMCLAPSGWLPDCHDLDTVCARPAGLTPLLTTACLAGVTYISTVAARTDIPE